MTVNEGPIEAIIEANVVTDNDVRLSLALDAATVSGNTICGNGQDITFEDDARPEIGEDADCEALAAASGS